MERQTWGGLVPLFEQEITVSGQQLRGLAGAVDELGHRVVVDEATAGLVTKHTPFLIHIPQKRPNSLLECVCMSACVPRHYKQHVQYGHTL